jgi:putative pyruvate formate lyase activating enzyme
MKSENLVLPGRDAGLSRGTYLNLMDQYHPCYKARLLPPLDRRITAHEHEEAVRLAHQTGLYRLDERMRLPGF